MYLVGYCIGYIIGPQTFQTKDAPLWRPAEITLILCWILGILDLYYILWHYKRQNKKKEAIRATPGYINIENQGQVNALTR